MTWFGWRREFWFWLRAPWTLLAMHIAERVDREIESFAGQSIVETQVSGAGDPGGHVASAAQIFRAARETLRRPASG